MNPNVPNCDYHDQYMREKIRDFEREGRVRVMIETRLCDLKRIFTILGYMFDVIEVPEPMSAWNTWVIERRTRNV